MGSGARAFLLIFLWILYVGFVIGTGYLIAHDGEVSWWIGLLWGFIYFNTAAALWRTTKKFIEGDNPSEIPTVYGGSRDDR